MLLLPYQDHWPASFAAIAAELSTCLSGLSVKVYHVGSTAVPGLGAKDIIDIDLEYPPDLPLVEIQQRLATLGYQHHGDQGIPQREVFKRKARRKDHPILDQTTHHLYACPTGSRELTRHLKFRDHLRQHPRDREAYEHLKQEIALAANQDKKTYAELKMSQARGFIESILKAPPPTVA